MDRERREAKNSEEKYCMGELVTVLREEMQETEEIKEMSSGG